MADDDMAPEPKTAEELIVRWSLRDNEYAKLRRPIGPDSIAAVRMMRMREAAHLPRPSERGSAYIRAKSWVPPVHPDFGNLHSWLEEE